ncbi:hypothetical protein FB45DRAFT_1052584 [Roridomyces roridus]|uniref:MYND-type domain-containing protein n=1 Tax=Roridomyces roridus TaxID=1738132 RepID=A0AAD7CA83_9AGAR|nr:hypothetical protein FB45DRAFT_1052584 [Roridomyces roridus]
MNPREVRLRELAESKYKFSHPTEIISAPELCAQIIVQLDSQVFIKPTGGTAQSIQWGPVIQLENLGSTLCSIPHNVKLGTPRKAPVQDAWNAIFESSIAKGQLDNVQRWIEFLYQLSSDFSSPGRLRISMEARAVVLGAIVNFLLACLELPEYSICYWINRHGALGILGNIWCLQAQWGPALPMRPVKGPGETLHFALLCWGDIMYEQVDVNREPPFSEELARQTKRDIHELAHAGLAHLIRDYTVLNTAEHEDRRAIVADMLVMHLLERDDGAIHPPFVARNAIHHTTRAMARVVCPRHPLRDDMSVEAMRWGCSQLDTYIALGDGLSSMIRAFEAGFLSSFLVGFDPSAAAAHARLLPFFKDQLQPYLVHLPVVRSAAKALRKIQRDSIERRIDRRSPIWKAWSDFKKLLEERIQVAGNAIYLVCASKSCNRVDYKDDCLRYCVGCMDSAYCSTECQRRDWVTGGHRAYCKEIRANRLEGKKVKLSAENKDYISRVLEKDRMEKGYQVLETMNRTKRLAVEFDYTTVPFKILPCETLEAQPSYTLVQVKLPGGKHSHLLRVKLPMLQGLADSVTAKGMGPGADRVFYKT